MDMKNIAYPTAVWGREINVLSLKNKKPKSTTRSAEKIAILPKRRTITSFKNTRVGPLWVKERRTKTPKRIRPSAKME